MVRKVMLVTFAALLALALMASAAVAQDLTPPIEGATVISNSLTGSTTVSTEGQIQLAWVDQYKPPTTAVVNVPFTVKATATNQTDAEIPGVLYIVEIKKGEVAATPTDVEITGKTEGEETSYGLGYDTGGKFFYWGLPSGFTFPAGSLTAEFTVKFKAAGTYSFTIYAVQLPQ